MVATPRRLLLALVALAASTPVFAGVTCVQVNPSTWVCSGDGGGSSGSDPDTPPYVVTNIVGVCTNCVNMSPSECESLKVQLSSASGRVRAALVEANENLSPAINLLYQLKQEGDSFIQTANGGEVRDLGPTSPQAPYLVSYVPGNNVFASTSSAGGGINSIYSYYNSAVKPVIEECMAKVGQAGGVLEYAESDLDTVDSLTDSINCEQCQMTGGGSGDGGGGGSSSGQCPCTEQMEALKDLLEDDFLPRVKRIDSSAANLTNILTIAREQLQVVKEGFHNTTNLLNRLDDYVLDDFSNRVHQINIDVNYIASNLTSKLNLFINNNYSNAVYYLDQDGMPVVMKDLKDTLVDEKNAEGNRFDFAEFGKLPWFTRIEFLLTDLAGYYDKTNNYSEVEEVQKKIKKLEEEVSSEQSSISNKIEYLARDKFSSVDTSLSRLWGYFSFFGSGTSSIRNVPIIEGNLSGYFGTGFHEVRISAFEGSELQSAVDDYDGLLTVVRYGFQALYLAACSFLLFRLLVFLCHQIGKVITMLVKFYAAVFGQ